MYGDTLRISSSDGDPDSMLVIGHTFLAESDTSLNRVHQVKGRDMVGRFLDAGRRRMIVEPNAEALYFLKDNDAPNGAVRTSADRIVFEFVDDEMKHVRAEGGVEGTYFPEGKLPDGDLEGFRWMADRRPSRDQMLRDRRLRSGFELLATSQASKMILTSEWPTVTGAAPAPARSVINDQP